MKIFKKGIDKYKIPWYNSRALTNGGIAQLARATGSYPVGHGFKSNSRYQRPVGQAAKTPPFHGGNGSSILPRVTNQKHPNFQFGCFLFISKQGIHNTNSRTSDRAYLSDVLLIDYDLFFSFLCSLNEITVEIC